MQLLALVGLVLLIAAQTPVPNNSGEVTIKLSLNYEGELLISATGAFVQEVLGEAINECEMIPGEGINLAVRYYVTINLTFDEYLSNRTVVAEFKFRGQGVQQASPSSSCITLLVSRMLSNTSIPKNPHDYPIKLRMYRGVAELVPPSRQGKVVAIAHYGIDVVQLKEEYLFSSMLYGMYIYSFDLYYEPITGAPIHYVEVLINKTSSGSLMITSYVTLIAHNLNYADVFKDVVRRETIDIIINETGTQGITIQTYKTALVLIYASPPNLSIEPSINVHNNTINLQFKIPVKCFVVVGPLKSKIVDSSIELSSYTIKSLSGEEYVYYTETPLNCSSIEVRLGHSALEISQEVVFPEKLPPPHQALREDVVSVSVATLVLVVSIVIFCLLYYRLVRRLL